MEISEKNVFHVTILGLASESQMHFLTYAVLFLRFNENEIHKKVKTK
jgi:hypothetical protein